MLNIALTQNLYWNLVWIRQLLRLKRNVLFWRIKTSTLGYRGENSAVKSVAYLFENGKLTSSAIALSYSYTEEIAKFLSERYQVIGKDSDGAYYFINNDSDKYNMGVRLSV